MFNCDWIYTTKNCSHVIFYAIMSSLIVTDNKFAFKYFEDKVNDLIAEHDFSQAELVTIGHNWQRIGDLMAQSKSLRWQKMLKESVDRFPSSFTEMASRCILDLPSKKQFSFS